jgi:hypothetical protein
MGSSAWGDYSLNGISELTGLARQIGRYFEIRRHFETQRHREHGEGEGKEGGSRGGI